jgi:hypothetical protein
MILAVERDVEWGRWDVGSTGEGYLRHDCPEVVIRWTSGIRIVTPWPNKRFTAVGQWKQVVPPMSADDGRGPSGSAASAGSDDDSDVPLGQSPQSRCAAAAVVSRPRLALADGEAVHAVGVALPKVVLACVCEGVPDGLTIFESPSIHLEFVGP